MLAPSWRCVLYGHITKAGDPVLRSILIQCARTGIKSDKRLKEFYMRIKQNTKRKRRQ
jgi:transposase